jgi:hypothetical protein
MERSRVHALYGKHEAEEQSEYSIYANAGMERTIAERNATEAALAKALLG